jgi:FkbM family methyltransferase
MREFRQARSKPLYLWHNFAPRRYANLVRHVRNWPAFLAWKWRKGPATETFQIVLRNGFLLTISRSNRVEFKTIFLREDYTWPIARSEVGPGVIIDLGANIGLFTIFAAQVFPGRPIVSVEPFPRNFHALTASVQSNRVPDCTLVNAAVAGSAGRVVFGCDSGVENPTDASINSARVPDGKDFFECRCLSLDDLFREQAIDSAAFVKMDIEGAEYDCLYNASDEVLKKIRHLAMETSNHDSERRNTAALAAFLRVKGFRVREITPEMLHASRPN